MALMLTPAVARAVKNFAATPLLAAMRCPTAASTAHFFSTSTSWMRPAAIAFANFLRRIACARSPSTELTAKHTECSDDACTHRSHLHRQPAACTLPAKSRVQLPCTCGCVIMHDSLPAP